MKNLKNALVTLASSPLLWIGVTGALTSFITYFLLWSGHLMWLADLCDSLHVSTYIGTFLSLVFVLSVFLAVVGFLLGILRLSRKLSNKLEREHHFHLFRDPEQRKRPR
jgi:hypothetical protein